MVEIRLIERDDMQYINRWWKEHGWEPVHPYMLSRTGYVVSQNDEPVVAGWYIKTNGGGALLEWIVKNPSAPKKAVDKCLDVLVSSVESYAKEDGYLMILTFIEHKSLKRFLTKRQYLEADKAMDVYLKEL